MEYKEDDWLQLSGIQHFTFCRRQWALIHIEQIWEENLRTVEGQLLHGKAHDATENESRGDTYIMRDISVQSRTLGVSGKCDVVEFHRGEKGIPLKGKTGVWQPYPVEYKRGSPKNIDADRLQLCGQAMCLEEMLSCDIPCGALFYGETRRRETVEFTDELRNTVKAYLAEMHDHFRRGYTPRVKTSKSCNACSISDHCLPRLMKQQTVREYVNEAITEEK